VNAVIVFTLETANGDIGRATYFDLHNLVAFEGAISGESTIISPIFGVKTIDS
jgi:hypothetical protein